MILILHRKATEEQIKQMAEDFGGLYIKVVVDTQRKVLAGGGERHVDAEQVLLKDGSKQKYLWGGGIDVKSKQIDYNSMINIRPFDNNPSRDILSEYIREEFDKIVKKIFL